MKKILSLSLTFLLLNGFSLLTHSEQTMQENQPITKVEKKVLPTKMLQEIYDTGDPAKLKSFFIDVTPIALKYIPPGATQQEAIALLKKMVLLI